MTKLMLKVMLVAAVSPAVSLWPAMAAKKMSKKMAGACGQPSGRCISDCNEFGWCRVNTCDNGQSTMRPLLRCYEPSGLCSPRC